MNIIILGAGTVGSTLAENLAREANDITIVDSNPALLADLAKRLDIRTLVGSASHPDILRQAEAESADMLIAVTNSDEINMTACQVAYTLFQTPQKIARIRARSYLNYPVLFDNKHIPIDDIINPEVLVTNVVIGLIQYPGAYQVLNFADGLLQMVALQPEAQGPLVGKLLADLCESLKAMQVNLVGLFRQNRAQRLCDELYISSQDELFVLATPKALQQFFEHLGRYAKATKRIFIAGGGRIGSCLAHKLEKDYQLKIIEQDAHAARQLSEALNNVTVLQGEAADKALLVEENIEYTDVFIAVTNDDEANIMACLQAKRLGAKQVMALINRQAYLDLIANSEIDIAISPARATTSTILTRLRRGDIVHAYSLRHGDAEAIEIILHGDAQTSNVVGRALNAVKMPEGTMIGAIVRQSEVIISGPETVFYAGDHVVIFIDDKKKIAAVESLFQVKFGYF